MCCVNLIIWSSHFLDICCTSFLYNDSVRIEKAGSDEDRTSPDRPPTDRPSRPKRSLSPASPHSQPAVHGHDWDLTQDPIRLLETIFESWRGVKIPFTFLLLSLQNLLPRSILYFNLNFNEQTQNLRKLGGTLLVGHGAGCTSTINPRTRVQGSTGSGVPPRHHPTAAPSLTASTAIIYLRSKIFPDSGDPLLHLPVIYRQLKNPQLHLHVAVQAQLGQLLQEETGRLTFLDGGPGESLKS